MKKTTIIILALIAATFLFILISFVVYYIISENSDSYYHNLSEMNEYDEQVENEPLSTNVTHLDPFNKIVLDLADDDYLLMFNLIMVVKDNDDCSITVPSNFQDYCTVGVTDSTLLIKYNGNSNSIKEFYTPLVVTMKEVESIHSKFLSPIQLFDFNSDNLVVSCVSDVTFTKCEFKQLQHNCLPIYAHDSNINITLDRTTINDYKLDGGTTVNVNCDNACLKTIYWHGGQIEELDANYVFTVEQGKIGQFVWLGALSGNMLSLNIDSNQKASVKFDDYDSAL